MNNPRNDDIMLALMDLFSIVCIGTIELFGKLIQYALNISKKSDGLKKIEPESLLDKQTTNCPDAIGYSVTRKKDILAAELFRNRHTAICGASGFGKSVLLTTLMDADMRVGKPVIFIDPKGDGQSLRQFIDLCRYHRRSFAVFSEHYGGTGKFGLNPVKDGGPTHIADRIHHSFNWSEEHYETLCYRALKMACSLLHSNVDPVSMEAIQTRLLEISEPNDSHRLFDRKNVEGIIARLENIVESDFGPILGGNGLSFKEVWESKQCIYIGLPVLGYPHIARALGKIILGDLAFAVYHTYKKPMPHKLPIGVYIDELSAVITDEFIELLNKCRGVGMELTFAFQSPSDIDKVSRELCRQILENASNWFVLKQRMESGADVFAQAIGTVPGKKETVRTEDGQEQAQGSQREVHELIAHHNIVKNLGCGQAILLTHAPTRVELLNVKYISPDFLEKEGQQ